MTPELKEQIISFMKENGHFCLMCGDGANDVGALKQSHVGVALLSGFGSLNVDKSSGANKDEHGKVSTNANTTTNKPPPNPIKQQPPAPAGPLSQLLSQQQLTSQQRREMVQAKLEKEVEDRIRRGESCPWFRAFSAIIRQQSEEARKQAQDRQNQGFAGHAQRVALEKYLSEMEDTSDLPMVKLGDASVAAPFTSKTPSIQATVDIIKQGRCALVTTLQMYQILALNCLISAYSLSVLYLDGIKYGDSQMMASGILMTISFLTLSRATPLNELSAVRPLTTIFHPALFFSLLGQFVIHLGCMVYATYLTKQYTPNWEPNLYGKFEPSLLNTVVFLMSTVQSVSVFVTNYKGRPFMIGMVDNPGLLYSLGLCIIGVFIAATEALPTFNKILQLVPFPNPGFAETILMILVMNIISTLTWDFLMSSLFYPAMVKESIRAVKREDIYKLAKMIFFMYLLIQIFTPAEEDLEKLQEEFAKWNY